MARAKRGRTALAGYLFLLPNLLDFLAFTRVPVMASLGSNFFEWDLFSPPKFVGFQDFSALLRDHDFWRDAFNTVFLMLTIPVNILGSLFLARVMNQKLRGIVVFRTIDFLPTIVMGVRTYLLLWMFSTSVKPADDVFKSVDSPIKALAPSEVQWGNYGKVYDATQGMGGGFGAGT